VGTVCALGTAGRRFCPPTAGSVSLIRVVAKPPPRQLSLPLDADFPPRVGPDLAQKRHNAPVERTREARSPAVPRPVDGSGEKRTADTGDPRIPRLAVSIAEACGALGVSHDFWHEHIAADIRIIRRGRRKLVALDELRRWLDGNGNRVLPRP
jgi:hypothetical protein